jgi:enhancing lycopene biosynthesis protein 2
MLRASLVARSKKVAVLLSGCGVFDGSEIHEATSVLIHLSRLKLEYNILAPNRNQFHVVNHQQGAPDANSSRNMMAEAARIARGAVVDATQACATSAAAEAFAREHAALILPGGFGVMKNLSTFAVAAASEAPAVLPEVVELLVAFHRQHKPIGAACIAPILLAHCFSGCSITLGSLAGDAQSLAVKLGAQLVDCSGGGVAVDAKNKLVSAPAYMVDGARPAEVFSDIGLLVDNVREYMAKS